MRNDGRDRWKVTDDLFRAVLELPVGERSAFLDDRCDDPQIRARLERLLRFAEDPENSLAPGAALDGPLGEELAREVDATAGEHLLAAVLDTARAMLEPGHTRIGRALVNHGEALAVLDRFAEAEGELLEGYGILRESYDKEHRHVVRSVDALVRLYERWEKPAESGHWSAMLSGGS